jgi:pimeloyl-ACP methyl ester carboxylesterase
MFATFAPGVNGRGETLGSGYHRGWVLAGGVRTHYWWAGTEGPVVLLLHGGGPGASGEAAWRHMLPALADAGFRAIAPDQLSYGYTDARPHAWPIRGHQSLVDHIRDFVDALCLEEVGIVGNSRGAYVGVKYALEHPERVSRLFLISSGTIATAMRIPWPGRESNPGLLALRDFDYTAAGVRRFLETIVNDPAALTDELVEARAAICRRPGVREASEAFLVADAQTREQPRLWEVFSLEHALPSCLIPGKLVWGRADKFAPLEMGEALAARVPQFEFEVVDAGHQAQTDAPELLNRMACDYFSARTAFA